MPDLVSLLREAVPGGEMALAYSGGLDSRFLAHMARRAGLSVRALHIKGPHVPSHEHVYALDWAQRAGIAVTVVALDPLRMPELRNNPRDRCYHCKRSIFIALRKAAGDLPLCDGTNASDKGEYRPGLKALAELAVISPLAEAGLTKDAIRRMGTETGLENPDQAAKPCLLTRFGYNTPIDAERLTAVDAAEQAVMEALALRGCGEIPFRLRYESPGNAALHLEMAAQDDTLDAALTRVLAEKGFSGAPVRRMASLSGFFDRKI
ncbi:ATP-dependent sacrificial sulfur transferase LarE [Desulfovibrio sp. OttesenSCG-928-O18]|nr:ATP-dependent sacrificial sulfur transferase LarE [Desulfovibrio sp. OttesenSCG-928-O18]